MKVRVRGFTLIELLIVVAIIAILAAIAVPNFLEAQVRSKVSRVKADERTYATGLEAYYTDWNQYPKCLGCPPDLISTLEEMLIPLSTPISYLTTALLPEPFNGKQGAALYEGYDVIGAGGAPPGDRATRKPIYLYIGLPDDATVEVFAVVLIALCGTLPSGCPIPSNEIDSAKNEIVKKRWYVISPGPDTFYSYDRCIIGGGNILGCIAQEVTDCSIISLNGVYDPTNGTVSYGEIVRTGEGIFMQR